MPAWPPSSPTAHDPWPSPRLNVARAPTPQTEVPELDVEEWARAKPSTISKTLDFIDDTFGSVEDYLDSIGFDMTWREKLRDVLLRPENRQLRRNLSLRESQRRGSARQAAADRPRSVSQKQAASKGGRGPRSVSEMMQDVEEQGDGDTQSVASATPLLSGRNSAAAGPSTSPTDQFNWV